MKLQSGGFRTCAPTHLARGYVPVPLLNGKGQTPEGATGYAGVDVDERLVTTWAATTRKQAFVSGLTG